MHRASVWFVPPNLSLFHLNVPSPQPVVCDQGLFADGSSCVPRCPAGKYGDAASGTCERCNAQCAGSCTGTAFSSTTIAAFCPLPPRQCPHHNHRLLVHLLPLVCDPVPHIQAQMPAAALPAKQFDLTLRASPVAPMAPLLTTMPRASTAIPNARIALVRFCTFPRSHSRPGPVTVCTVSPRGTQWCVCGRVPHQDVPHVGVHMPRVQPAVRELLWAIPLHVLQVRPLAPIAPLLLLTPPPPSLHPNFTSMTTYFCPPSSPSFLMCFLRLLTLQLHAGPTQRCLSARLSPGLLPLPERLLPSLRRPVQPAVHRPCPQRVSGWLQELRRRQ